MVQTINLTKGEGPHAKVPVLLDWNIANPKKVLLLFHGRGSSAENILGLTNNLELPNDVLVCAPEAAGHQWYPQRFIVPRTQNEPYLSSALDVVDSLIDFCAESYKIKADSVTLVGFSQGACLVADYIVRNPKKYAGVCIFSGGLIGTDEEVDTAEWNGSLGGTPVYIGCDGNDPHIPRARVEATATILNELDAAVTSRIYVNLGHTVHSEGIKFLQQLYAL